MGGVLKRLIFSYLQNPTGYEFEQDRWLGPKTIVQTV